MKIFNFIVLSLIPALSLMATESKPKEVWIPWGEPQESYQIYGISTASDPRAYQTGSKTFDRFTYLPLVSKSEATFHPEGSSVHIRIGSFAGIGDERLDLSLPVEEGAEQSLLRPKVENVEIYMSESFKERLKEIKKDFPEAYVEVDDYRGRFRRLIRLSLNNMDLLEKNISTLFGVALKNSRSLKVYITVPNQNVFKKTDFDNLEPFSLVVKALVYEPVEMEKDLLLPKVQNLELDDTTLNQSIEFYKAYQAIDQFLIPVLQVQGELKNVEETPTDTWRRHLIERLFPIYFEDELNSETDVCKGYSVRLRSQINQETLKFEYLQLEEKEIIIPQRIVKLEDL